MITIAIVGASGYSGTELLKILLSHPQALVRKVFANSAAKKRADEIYPFFFRKTDLVYEKYSFEQLSDVDLVFIALPSGEAMHLVPQLLNGKKRVIDLGGDFRLKDVNAYERYYGREHTAASYLPEAVYGLPEWNKEQIRAARLVANPGCYPTSAILPLAPMVKENVINERGIIINSLSGVSGAGRSASGELSFVEVNESVRAYKVGVHQHSPEIHSAINMIADADIKATFVPHLLPITRGIYSSLYGTLKRKISQEEIHEIYRKYYSSSCFVRLHRALIPEIKNVNYTNYCDIGFRVDEDNKQLIMLSVIDNLIKGAAGQAVQNMNIMYDLSETTGLLHIET